MRNKIVFLVGYVSLTLLYAYAFTQAVGNVLGVLAIGNTLEQGFSSVGYLWAALITVFPVAVFALSVIFGLKRQRGSKLLLLGLGLAFIAAWQINLLHFVSVTGLLV